MPVDKQVLLRYQVLNDCFRNPYREYDIDDLVDACSEAMRGKLDMTAGVSKRTVQNDIANLQLPPYSIRLDETFYRGKKRLYRYTDTNYSLPMYRMNDSERHKIQDAIYVLRDFEGEPLYDWARTVLMQVEGGLLSETTKTVVSFQTNPDLKGLNLFNDLLQAILSKRVLRITYAPFGKDSYQERIYPYHLKQYNDRWYLIAQAVGYDTLAHYALDRIDGFEEIQMKYKEADVDFEEYFDDVIGVTVPEGIEPVDVLLRVSNNRFNYIKTKPLHLSQRVVRDEDGHTVISINVKINKELIALILSFGPDIEVLAPAPLKAEIAKNIRAMSDKYNINAENLHT
ncbi:YafY family protein [Prevotella sp. P6B4]|uniref:helix-turn-helix transcriptional regulator n=1 Tax=Prevotella sp. P6B4 TaxID=1410614 RepID=UPI00048F3194|nr:WYL domain-containing protein [Prevotella sp. P6B4]